MDVTIKDVAREAKVAPSTVSRVIKDSPSISQETKARVREVMERLGYHPNFQAQSLAGRNTQAIGIVMPNSAFDSFQNPFFPEVLRGISTSANQHKYGLYLSTSATEESILEEVKAMVHGKRVDGILLLYSRKNDKLITYLANANIPFTVVGRPNKKEQQITYVDNDNVHISWEVTNHLVKLGHRRIGFIGGNMDFMVTVDRFKGFTEALEDAGISLHEDYIVSGRSIKEEGLEIIERMMQLEQPPTAFVTQDDLIAYQMISHLETLNYRVPDDMSIVSFNNHSLSEHSRPPLTSVDINIFQLGMEATECLIEKVEKPETPPKRITVPATLIVRSSEQKIEDEKSRREHEFS